LVQRGNEIKRKRRTGIQKRTFPEQPMEQMRDLSSQKEDLQFGGQGIYEERTVPQEVTENKQRNNNFSAFVEERTRERKNQGKGRTTSKGKCKN